MCVCVGEFVCETEVCVCVCVCVCVRGLGVLYQTTPGEVQWQ
jgi:hypothetical protein